MRLSKNILRKKMWNLKQQYGQHQYKVFETLHFRKIKFRMCVCFGMEGMGARVSLLLVQPQIGHKRWSYRSRFLPSLDDNSDKQRKKRKKLLWKYRDNCLLFSLLLSSSFLISRSFSSFADCVFSIFWSVF